MLLKANVAMTTCRTAHHSGQKYLERRSTVDAKRTPYTTACPRSRIFKRKKRSQVRQFDNCATHTQLCWTGRGLKCWPAAGCLQAQDQTLPAGADMHTSAAPAGGLQEHVLFSVVNSAMLQTIKHSKAAVHNPAAAPVKKQPPPPTVRQ